MTWLTSTIFFPASDHACLPTVADAFIESKYRRQVAFPFLPRRVDRLIRVDMFFLFTVIFDNLWQYNQIVLGVRALIALYCPLSHLLRNLCKEETIHNILIVKEFKVGSPYLYPDGLVTFIS